MIIFPIYFRQYYFIIPPLFVAYIEMSSPHSPLQNHMPKVILLMGIAAFIGSSLVQLSIIIPPIILVVIANAIVLIVMSLLSLYLPPAGAVVTLPFLLYPLNLTFYTIEVIIGILIMSFVVKLFFKE